MALVIVPGSADLCRVDDKETVNDLAWLQKTVGGYIESFHFPDLIDIDGETFAGMILNEEGKLMDLAINHVATLIARKGGLPADDYIVGNAILFKKGEIE